MSLLKALLQHLQSDRARIVRSRQFLVERWDPTYGPQDPTTESVDVVDFDALCASIEEFASNFEADQ